MIKRILIFSSTIFISGITFSKTVDKKSSSHLFLDCKGTAYVNQKAYAYQEVFDIDVESKRCESNYGHFLTMTDTSIACEGRILDGKKKIYVFSRYSGDLTIQRDRSIYAVLKYKPLKKII